MLLILNRLRDTAFEKLTEIIWGSGCYFSLERIYTCFLLVVRDTSNPRIPCLNQGFSVLKMRFNSCEGWFISSSFLLKKKKDFTYLFLDRGERREKERERNINVWLPLACPTLRTWPTTQACAPTGNRTSSPLIHRPVLNPLSYISQGSFLLLKYNSFKTPT